MVLKKKLDSIQNSATIYANNRNRHELCKVKRQIKGGLMKSKFKKKYVLGTGYPWAYGTKNYTKIGVNEDVIGFKPVVLDIPEDIWSNSLPKYRLILERVE